MKGRLQNARRKQPKFLASIAGMLVLTIVLILISPGLRTNLAWRFDEVKAYVRGAISPRGGIPAAAQDSNVKEMGGVFLPGGIKEAVDLPSVIATPQERQIQAAQQVLLPPPEFDIKKDIQDWNNCGPGGYGHGIKVREQLLDFEESHAL